MEVGNFSPPQPKIWEYLITPCDILHGWVQEKNTFGENLSFF